MSLTYLEFTKLLGYINYFHQLWDVLGHYFFKYFFCSFLSSPFRTLIMCVLIGLLVLYRHLRRCSFSFSLFFFLLFLRLDHLNGPIIEFADSFFCLFNSDVEPLNSRISQLQNSDFSTPEFLFDSFLVISIIY